MRIEWTEPALSDMESIRKYIGRDSEYYTSSYLNPHCHTRCKRFIAKRAKTLGVGLISMPRTNEATDTDLKVIEDLSRLGWKRGDTLLYQQEFI